MEELTGAGVNYEAQKTQPLKMTRRNLLHVRDASWIEQRMNADDTWDASSDHQLLWTERQLQPARWPPEAPTFDYNEQRANSANHMHEYVIFGLWYHVKFLFDSVLVCIALIYKVLQSYAWKVIRIQSQILCYVIRRWIINFITYYTSL